ncbi:DUF3821 domain-containing protein [Methanoplanus sp. FWC-SCC4]|uniref:DUF3821 domain-containing protein n=1 Tax=Methanochimaera problematica TaxID=2609417 RepID=A0AA97I2U5_9EURY|nr:DUF3821 domain-containing protein [Methanoplanus sp. FWC-SCC4]WOF15191.1 DUF3821 domain-containing protein [Methanoplanus sp. FWC-SCC4]
MAFNKKSALCFAFCLLSLVLFAVPASAAINNIHKGDTVFVGEENLILDDDVFYSSGGVLDTQLAYYKNTPATSAPDYVMTPSKESFFLSSSEFKDRTGGWYSYPNGSSAGHIAFYVQYPYLQLKLWAYRTGGNSFDITEGKIVSGEALDFRIDSNLYPLFSRTGVLPSDDGVDIYVETEDGATYTALYDCSGNSVSITDIHVANSAFFVPDGSVTCVWDTGNSAYKTGSYTIWAECNVNGMKDNLGSISGVTVTDPIGTVQKTEEVTVGFTPAPEDTPAPTASPEVTTTPQKTKTPTIPPVTDTPAPVKTTMPETVKPTAEKPQTEKLPQTPVSGVVIISAVIGSFMLAVLIRRNE